MSLFKTITEKTFYGEAALFRGGDVTMEMRKCFNSYDEKKLLELTGNRSSAWSGLGSPYQNPSGECEYTLLMLACLEEPTEDMFDLFFLQIRRVNRDEPGFFERQITKTTNLGNTAFTLLCNNVVSPGILQKFMDFIVEAGGEALLRKELTRTDPANGGELCLTGSLCRVTNTKDYRELTKVGQYKPLHCICSALFKLNMFKQQLEKLAGHNRLLLQQQFCIGPDWTPDLSVQFIAVKGAVEKNDLDTLKLFFKETSSEDVKKLFELQPAAVGGRTLLMELYHDKNDIQTPTVKLLLDEYVRVACGGGGGDKAIVARRQFELTDASKKESLFTLVLRNAMRIDIIELFIKLMMTGSDESNNNNNNTFLKQQLQKPQPALFLVSQTPIDVIIFICFHLYDLNILAEQYRALPPSMQEGMKKSCRIDADWIPLIGFFNLLERAIESASQHDIKSAYDNIMSIIIADTTNNAASRAGGDGDKNNKNNNNNVKRVLQDLLQQSNLIARVAAKADKLILESVVMICSLVFRFNFFAKQFAVLHFKMSMKQHNVDASWTPLVGAFSLLQQQIDRNGVNATTEIKRVFSSLKQKLGSPDDDEDDLIKQLLGLKDLTSQNTILLHVCNRIDKDGVSFETIRLLLDEALRVGGEDFLCQEQLMAQDESGDTCLMHACSRSHDSPDIINTLLEEMIEFGDRDLLRWQVEHKNKSQYTAAQALCLNKHCHTQLRSAMLNISSLLLHFDLLQSQGAELAMKSSQTTLMFDSKIDFVDDTKKKIKKKADERKIMQEKKTVNVQEAAL